jgi:histidine ammonia-lyase
MGIKTGGSGRGLWAGMAVAVTLAGAPAWAADYRPIEPTMAGQTITLTGKDMTIEQVVAIARYGAKVVMSPESLKRQADAYGLMLQGSTEGMAIYGFNRGSGAGREISLFQGDPLSPQNREYFIRRQTNTFEDGPRQGVGPETSEEEVARALMAVRANNMAYEAASPALGRVLVDMLNHRITPVLQSRGTLGEADLPQMGNVVGAMGGQGDVYYQGKRMTAAEGFRQAGVAHLQPLDAIYTSAFHSSNAFTTGLAALMIADAKEALDWADLIYAIDLNAMNSSVTPLSTPVQNMRPFQYANLDAARILDMIRGSYLLGDDPTRIIQDPESLRASFSRQGAAWKAWATLRDTVLLQMNSSDHNPAMVLGKPTDSWELSTPQMMKYFVKGGPYSNGQSGFIFSNANWDPYPMANEIEAFSNAMANMGVAVVQRIYRFSSTFFTVVSPGQVLSAEQVAAAAPNAMGYEPTAIWQELHALAQNQTPEGNPVSATVEELQSMTILKVTRGRQIVEHTFRLLGGDLLTGAFWLDIRKAQDPSRTFGAGPTAAHAAFRRAVPWQMPASQRPKRPEIDLGYEFLKANKASAFYPAAAAHIDGGRFNGRP